jgi:histidine kinase
MKLGQKLFLSHLAMVMISLALLGILTLAVTPVIFTAETDEQYADTVDGLQVEVNESEAVVSNNLTSAIVTALIAGGLVAILLAAAMSWFVSRRIVQPLGELAIASRYIADGHYDHRLTVQSADEVGELAGHFNAMAGALSEIEHTRRRLLADVSHELKTPLVGIKGYMEGLQDGIIPASVETYHLVYREADRLERLVHDLQELSQAEAKTPILLLEPCSLTDLLNRVVTQLTPQFQAKSVQLQSDCPTDSPLVCVDKDRIGQVMINLIGNALQYTPADGCVAVRVQPNGKTVQILVEDTGIGLAADELKRIFQRFYRVDKSRARLSGGSGIGLTIARYWVEAHGGTIWAESGGLGQGSRFHVSLPSAAMWEGRKIPSHIHANATVFR